MEKANCLQYQIGDDSAEFEDNNANTIGAIVELTKDHPGLILQGSIDGTNEDRYDNRAFRIRAGCIEEVQAQITYPEFTTILTDEEKEARAKAQSDTLWPSSVDYAAKGMGNEGTFEYAVACILLEDKDFIAKGLAACRIREERVVEKW